MKSTKVDGDLLILCTILINYQNATLPGYGNRIFPDPSEYPQLIYTQIFILELLR